MLLRAFLVILVAALGLGLPLSGSLDSWMQTDRSGGGLAESNLERLKPTPPISLLSLELHSDLAGTMNHANREIPSPIDFLNPPPLDETPALEVPAAAPVENWASLFGGGSWDLPTVAVAATVDQFQAGSRLVENASALVGGRVAGLPNEFARMAQRRDQADTTFAVILDEVASSFANDLVSAVAPPSPMVDAPISTEQGFLAMMDETVVLFAADLAANPATAVATIDTNLVSSEDVAFASVLDETVSGFTADMVATNVLASVERVVAPIVSEVAEVPADPAAAVEEEDRGRTLAEAVRLTNRAVSAWVDLLHAHTIISLIP